MRRTRTISSGSFNPCLLLLGGLTGTFVLAAFLPFVSSTEALTAIQPLTNWIIYFGLVTATCVGNKYIQLSGWFVLTISTGFRFPIFITILRSPGVLTAVDYGLIVPIMLLFLWACVIVARVIIPRFGYSPVGRNIAIVTMAQLMIGIIIQSFIAAI